MNTTTTLLFLKSNLSRDRFTAALEWVKAQERRLYLSDEKLWVLDLRLSPEDPSFEQALEEVREAGWSIVGSTLWDAEIGLRGNEKALASLADLCVPNNRRNPK